MRFIRTNERLENFSNALTWLTQLTQVSSSSRFYSYLKVLQEIVDFSDLPNGGTSENQMDKIIEKYGENEVRGATLEIDELIEIYNAFYNQPDIIPKTLLDKIVVGKSSETEEEPDKPNSSNPRNTLFELIVAARIQSSGLYSKLNEDADVVFNFRNYKVFIECKRLFGERNFEPNLRKANDQLVKRYQKFGLPKNLLGIYPVGFTCFSLTKVFNSQQLFLQANSADEIKFKIDNMLDEIVEKHKELIRRKNHSNTIGMIFYVRVPVLLPSGIGAMNRWRVFPSKFNTHKFNKTYEQIVQKLKNRSIT